MISKQNFITVYGRAHLRALTPNIIRAAFRKTGVWPFNPSVITQDMMAPSRETSCEGHLPVVPATPVRVIAKLLQDLSINDAEPNQDGDAPSSLINNQVPPLPSHTTALSTTPEQSSAINQAIQQLSQTKLAYLVSSEPMPTVPITSGIQHNTQLLISPMKTGRIDALAIEPKSKNEIILLAALRESEARAEQLKKRTVELQASNVLNEMYCNQLRRQLAYQENKKNEPKGKGKLVGDGQGCCQGMNFTKRLLSLRGARNRKKGRKLQERRQNKSGHKLWWHGESLKRAGNKKTRLNDIDIGRQSKIGKLQKQKQELKRRNLGRSSPKWRSLLVLYPSH